MDDSSRPARLPDPRPGPDSGCNPYGVMVPKFGRHVGEPGTADEHATTRPDPGGNPYGIMVPKFFTGSHVTEPGTGDDDDHDGPFTNIPPKRERLSSYYKYIGLDQLPGFTLSELRSFITTPPSSPPSDHSSVSNASGLVTIMMVPSPTQLQLCLLRRPMKQYALRTVMFPVAWSTRLRDESSTPHDIPLQELKEITDNFSDERILGRGGFGVVYKGLLRNGEKIAVKRIVSSLMPGQQKQFESKVYHLMMLKHPNIVRCVGYCYEIQNACLEFNGKYVFAEMAERLLCMEYMPKGRGGPTSIQGYSVEYPNILNNIPVYECSIGYVKKTIL